MRTAPWPAPGARWLRRLALGITLSILACAAAAAGPGGPVLAVDAVGLTVSDLERSVRFFTEVLDFEPLDEFELAGDGIEHLTGVFGARVRVARLRLGDETIELTEYLASTGRPLPADSRSHDGWFQHIAIVVSDMERAYRHLRARGVEHASTGPQRLPDWNPQAGGISAFYFRDPDGHALEVIHFPAGKGNPRWQRAAGRLFLGIDHTAIVVRDTEASLRITALRAGAGPGIEFLEYLSPSDGRPYPPDSRGSDLWHWSTRLRVADAGARRRPGP